MDYKSVFGLLATFVVLVIILSLFTSIHQSALDNVNLRGLEAFETERYMAASLYVYSKGERLGEFDYKDSREFCDLDSEVLEDNNLGFDARSFEDCHSPRPFMSTVFVNNPDGTPIFFTLEAGTR